ncbi:MAG: TIGR01777 family oxidoreductase [Armatimonadota bacterium]
MKVVIIGGRGFLGRKVSEYLTSQGHDVLVSSRKPSETSFVWDGQNAVELAPHLAGVDAVVNLAGESIADKLWSESRKQLLYSSRVDTTAAVVKAANTAGVAVLVNASAVGIYGDTGDRIVDETQPAGVGYLADLCASWEKATDAFQGRCVNMRIGVVFGSGGGILARLVPLFRMGIGGPMGSGKHWMPWIHADDMARCVEWCLEKPIKGPVNAVAPQAVTNLIFSKRLAHWLRRPCVFSVPVFALRLVLGKAFVAEVLVSSQRIRPMVLESSGFLWKRGEIDNALSEALA